MRPFYAHPLLLVLTLVLAGCGPADDEAVDEAATTRQPIPSGISPAMVEWRADGVLVPSPDSLRKLPGYVVDSIFPPEEAMRRLQASVNGPAPTRFTGGAAGTDALLRSYWTALTRKDTLAISALVVDHAEFAYLYFPESAPFASGMQPIAAWILYENQTGRGLGRAFRTAESATGDVVGTTCREGGRDEGKSRTYGPCAVVLRSVARTDTLWIGSVLIRRDGVHKFLGLDNGL
jgi:hypothetical protein